MTAQNAESVALCQWCGGLVNPQDPWSCPVSGRICAPKPKPDADYVAAGIRLELRRQMRHSDGQIVGGRQGATWWEHGRMTDADLQRAADVAYLRALALQFEEGLHEWERPLDVVDELRAIAARIDGDVCGGS